MLGGKSKSKKHHASIQLIIEANNKQELQGKIIKIIRQSQGMSQEKLANILNISRPTVAAIEKRGCDGVQIFAIAEALGVDVNAFKC